MEIRIYKKVSRNALCPCGSGVKVKKCDCEGALARDDRVNCHTQDILRGNEIIGNWKEREEKHQQ